MRDFKMNEKVIDKIKFKRTKTVYKLIHGKSALEMETKVNKYLDDGWILLGATRSLGFGLIQTVFKDFME